MAYSHKRAAGPWQFIPSTARRFGLKIDWWIDERRDPIKSTRAAAEYLQDLYEMFGSWNLALAAYNAGERRIQRALKRAKSNDFWVLRRTRYIRRETKNYVPSYIAAAAIAIHPERFGLERVTYNTPLMYDEVTMYSPIDLSLVAEFTGVKTTDIKILNPELRRWCTPPNVSSYTLRIPRGTREQFIANLSNAREDELLYVELYTVKKGDTVWDLSKRFGVPSQAIIDLNYLNKRALIIAGKKIVFPSIRTSDDGSKHMRLRPILKKNPKSKTSL
jgi:membrane-bound lytic murein transglycosylase D